MIHFIAIKRENPPTAFKEEKKEESMNKWEVSYYHSSQFFPGPTLFSPYLYFINSRSEIITIVPFQGNVKSPIDIYRFLCIVISSYQKRISSTEKWKIRDFRIFDSFPSSASEFPFIFSLEKGCERREKMKKFSFQNGEKEFFKDKFKPTNLHDVSNMDLMITERILSKNFGLSFQ